MMFDSESCSDKTNRDFMLLNDTIKSLNSDLAEATGELRATKAELIKLQVAKQNEEDQRRKFELKLRQVKEERERQAAALNETTRSLQAALKDRESLIEQEDRIRSLIEEADQVIKLCRSAGNLDDELYDRLSIDANIGPEFLVMFKAKTLEIKNELRQTDQRLKTAQIENEHLKDQLTTATGSSETIPLLQSKLARSHSLNQEKEEQCQSLQAQLCKAELTVQEVKAKILCLHDKLVEEQEAASRHSLAAEELQRTCAEQEAAIRRLRESEKQVVTELESVKKDLNQAEREKLVISEELSRLEKTKAENEAELRQEAARNRTLREMFEKEKKKWEKMLFDRGDNKREEEEEEFIEASTEECDKCSDTMLEEDSFSASNLGYKMIFPGVVITLIAVFYYSLFTSQTPEQHPM